MKGRSNRAARAFVDALAEQKLSDFDRTLSAVFDAFFHYSTVSSPASRRAVLSRVGDRMDQGEALVVVADLVGKRFVDCPNSPDRLHEKRDLYTTLKTLLAIAEEVPGEVGAATEALKFYMPKTSDDPSKRELVSKLFAIYCAETGQHPKSVKVTDAARNPNRAFVEAVQDAFCEFFDLAPGEPSARTISEYVKNSYKS